MREIDTYIESPQSRLITIIKGGKRGRNRVNEAEKQYREIIHKACAFRKRLTEGAKKIWSASLERKRKRNHKR